MSAPPPSGSDSAAAPLLTDLLKAVSRSFYITLRALPQGMRRPISLGYLLARTSDTIADTEVLAPELRLQSLKTFGEQIAGQRDTPCNFNQFLNHQTRSKERELLARANESLSLLNTVTGEEKQLIRTVLATIISGQILDIERFQHGRADQVVPLQTPEELDDYTYRVAGCVGEFWTQVCYRHYLPHNPEPPSEVLENSIRFGKGLQLVNILRDFSDDLIQGRCYLPQSELDARRLNPNELIQMDQNAELTSLFEMLTDQARDHLAAGWQYTNALPWSWARMRLACAWPILIGFRTLDLLPLDDPANPKRRAKVTRREVKAIIAKSLLSYPFPRRWRRLGTTD